MKRLVIDRLDLDLRGVSLEAAEAAARLLGPALAKALAGRRIGGAVADRIDAGRISFPNAPEAQNLANVVAQRIATRTSGD